LLPNKYIAILFHLLLQTETRSFIAKFMQMCFKVGYCNSNILYIFHIIVYITSLFSFKWFLVTMLYFIYYTTFYFIMLYFSCCYRLIFFNIIFLGSNIFDTFMIFCRFYLLNNQWKRIPFYDYIYCFSIGIIFSSSFFIIVSKKKIRRKMLTECL